MQTCPLRHLSRLIGPVLVLFLWQACGPFGASASHRSAFDSHVNTAFAKNSIVRAAGLTCKHILQV